MTDPTPFNRLMGERVRTLAHEQRRTLKEVSIAAGVYENAAANISQGRDVSISTLCAIMYELDATPSDFEAVYADFSECKREAKHG